VASTALTRSNRTKCSALITLPLNRSVSEILQSTSPTLRGQRIP
jgi:hypothetical protein